METQPEKPSNLECRFLFPQETLSEEDLVYIERYSCWKKTALPVGHPVTEGGYYIHPFEAYITDKNGYYIRPASGRPSYMSNDKKKTSKIVYYLKNCFAPEKFEGVKKDAFND